MGGKKVGIIVFIICILLAVFVLVLSKVHINKVEPSSNTQTTMSSEVAEDSQKSIKQTSVTSDNESSKQAESSDYSDNSQSSTNSETLILDKIIAEDKLSYSGEDQETVGVVSDKFCYLQGNQVIYCIEIDLTMGTEGQKVEYYCTYNTYSGVSVGDKLSVVYKQTTANTFAVMSVSRAE